MFKVLQGERPDRPTSGFSDQLWGLLVTTWLEEKATQPSKRPPTSAILDRLKEDVSSWGKPSIQLMVPTQSRRCLTHLGANEVDL